MSSRVPFAVGARVRELGPTVVIAPVPTERPARSGTVRWSGSAMAVVQWDGAPAPDVAHPRPSAVAMTTWLEPVPAEDTCAPAPSDAPTALASVTPINARRSERPSR